jgi:hypothetical protein
MTARTASFSSSIALLGALVWANTGCAEFRCSTEISYKWQKQVDEEAHGSDPSAGKTGSAAPPAALTKAPQEPSTVRLMSLERTGADEVAAKAALQVEVERQRIRATEACKREHESGGTCVAMKLSARASILNSLSFGARSDLERALSAECRQQQGTCLSVDTLDPKCVEVAGAKPAESPTPEKKAPAKKK